MTNQFLPELYFLYGLGHRFPPDTLSTSSLPSFGTESKTCVTALERAPTVDLVLK